MKLAMFARQNPNEEILAFSRQVGATHILIASPITTEGGSYDYENLLEIKERVGAAGLEFGAIKAGLRGLDRKTLGSGRTLNKVVLGLPGRDEQIENWCTNLRNLGRAGIPVLAYDFTDFFLRTSRRDTARYGRGGGRFSAYDHELATDEFISADLGVDVTAAGEVTDEMLWANVTYFLKAVIPVAEEAGVRMALHPDDPPVPSLGGIARIFRSVEAFDRMVDIVPSDYNGIEFCQGTFAEMGIDIPATIRHFGHRNKIVDVHFRNVRGSGLNFQETFIDEGDTDMLEAMAAYHEVGFDGIMIDDHPGSIVGDDHEQYRAHAFAMGYMLALMRAVRDTN